MGVKEIQLDGLDWINLAEGMHKWRAFVNTVMNF